MIDVVFISDLHLHPEDQAIQERFNHFLEWARVSVKNIYILGDFFHAWAGDDAIDDWSRGIAHQLFSLKRQGINLFYMHGNRDFLLGKTFARLAGWTILSEPTVIQLGPEKILLVHGDRYCTKDLAHQRFRFLTRNKIFPILFLSLPLKYRERLVNQVRYRSQMNHSKTMEEMDVVAEEVIKHMVRYKVTHLIHGHTHKPGIIFYQSNSQKFKRYVLSDWDDKPQALCYHNTKGLYFAHL
ncbi:UDP-2,3-diacylglucosamine diphosphatase [Legionella anisa]|uniref:UDP-2,3-diacylglucosamine hydrolase n=1 Tax=Legionella anisa TaxID=28082 RepID=A0AAX0WUP3_9GAMM|nr:UDP-2,3-diacylglucosamine diphosphatase [Legionella anisa]AWN74229.1 UDP-2,3-diacylglucosamine diphosphatase [Legionella anisa]KTC72107.1 UDP-2,3-diacylglucosamine hydrolase [Legionella anisa]MBN5934330.1 UDP-2,3-diacylglucosamine diphosphatase [Legionella anisa]MCW8425739.1 UDP-2,3-diacylglucosamine diphosphatase [Legionella anisa]MCW8448831.1 UDP-2,3-diacylglucosamine diphosphatase [Legionella anisa]